MECHKKMQRPVPKPAWLKKRLPTGPEYEAVRRLLRQGRLHTVCQEARCPNIWECFSRGTATFLILGPNCTRNCRFCAVTHGPLPPPDPDEPERLADAVGALQLDYVVVTSVTRDDLPDGGGGQFAAVVRALHRRHPQTRVEVLVPDFQGNPAPLQAILEAGPHVLNHNIETVHRLYPMVRPEADYQRSLALLDLAGRMRPETPTKSGMMLGLGETPAEIRQTLTGLRDVGCSILTLGQYLQPTPQHLPVARYVTPAEFAAWQAFAKEAGFAQVVSEPFVRSSYHAKEVFEEIAP